MKWHSRLLKTVNEEIGKTGLETDINANSNKESKQTVRTLADLLEIAFQMFTNLYFVEN